MKKPRTGVRASMVAAALVAGLVLSACSPGSSGEGGENGDPSAPNDVVIGVSADSRTLDPGGSGEHSVIMFDRLLDNTAPGEFSPALATEWEQVDDRTWRFTLRDGVTFHNGDPMTAEDVVFSVQRMIENDTLQNYVQINPFFEKAVVVDENTVDIVSKKPLATFLNRLSQVFIVPQAVVEELGDEEFALNPVGTGPFKFESWATGSELVVTANEDYWDGAPEADSITLKVIPEPSSRMAALISGDIDLARGLPVEIADRLRQEPAVEVMETPTKLAMTFVIQTSKGGPLADPKVRQALNYALDKESLLDLMGGAATQMEDKSLMLGPLVNGFTDDVDDYEYDPEKARKLLAEAGYADGFTMDIDAPRDTYPSDVALVEAVSSMLAEVGVETNLIFQEFSSFVSKAIANESTGMFLFVMANYLNDAEYYYNLLLSSNGRGYFHTPEYDALIAEQAQIMDPEERREALAELDRAFVEEEAPWIFLWNMVEITGVAKDVSGVAFDLDVSLDYAKLTKSGS